MAEQTSRPPGTVAFTHEWYREFLEQLSEAGYSFRRFSQDPGAGEVDGDGVDGSDSGDNGAKEILLRHDIDLSVEAAVSMARIESEFGIKATYCVLLTSPRYNTLDRKTRLLLQVIESLGHEVALHFSTHEYWSREAPPGDAAIERRVREQLDVLETVVSPTRTVSFHRPPEWVLDREFDGFRNTYAPAWFSDIGYVADSSQRWRDEPPSVVGLPDAVQLLTHPGLWGNEDEPFELRVERAIGESCSRTARKTRKEFIEDTTSS